MAHILQHIDNKIQLAKTPVTIILGGSCTDDNYPSTLLTTYLLQEKSRRSEEIINNI